MLSKNPKMLKFSMMFDWEHKRVNFDYEIVFFKLSSQMLPGKREYRIVKIFQ